MAEKTGSTLSKTEENPETRVQEAVFGMYDGVFSKGDYFYDIGREEFQRQVGLILDMMIFCTAQSQISSFDLEKYFGSKIPEDRSGIMAELKSGEVVRGKRAFINFQLPGYQNISLLFNVQDDDKLVPSAITVDKDDKPITRKVEEYAREVSLKFKVAPTPRSF